MNLRAFEGEQVRLIDADGEEFTGYVGDYIFPEDNSPDWEEEAIVIDNPKYGHPIQFNASEIKSIETIK